ncbi:hypothetical protein AcV7_003525 [Taiwanofungus camphoratus]|nr:hypothetical protein AcV7_003525 [Antrodia cinnamomea]
MLPVCTNGDKLVRYVDPQGMASTPRYVVAALTFIIWDLVVHFTDEVKYVWRGRNGWFRWLYCFIPSVYLLWQKPRFLPSSPKGGLVRTFFSMATCSLSETIESVLLESVIIAVEVVLILRGSDTGSPSTLHYHNVFLRCLL